MPLRLRIGVHVGEVITRNGNLYGDPVNRCARIRGLGHGGQTLLSTAVYEVVRDRLTDGLSLVDLGEHRMKDLVRPERVWQLDVTGLPAAFPALASLDLAKHNLPVQPTPLIGRSEDLAELVEMLRRERLVTVAGFGGMGKTRLALQAAAEVADGDADGVWFIDLSATTESERVPSEVAQVLGIRESGQGPATAVLEVLRDKRMLLVLDNLEQVLDCAGFVSDVVTRCPEITVLTTSREPLRLSSERVLHLAPLRVRDVHDDAPALSTYSAVQLFVERATAVSPAFAVGNDNAAAVAALCVALEGHPLAIELAAARVRVLTPRQILDRLDNALALLQNQRRDAPDRHRTLRATIAWSYDTLSDTQQLLLQRLSVFAASFPLDAIEAICGDGLDVIEDLTALVDKSLVKRREDRYSLLVSIREFAAEHLPEGARGRLADRHARWFPDQVRMDGCSRAELEERERRVRLDLPELQQALQHLLRSEALPQLLAFPPLYFMALADLGRFQDVEATLDWVLAAAPDPSRGRATAMYGLANLYDVTGWYLRSGAVAERMLEMCRAMAAEDETARDLVVLALVFCLYVEADPERGRVRADEIEAVFATVPEGGPWPRWWLEPLVLQAASHMFRECDPARAVRGARRLTEIGETWAAYGLVTNLAIAGSYQEAADLGEALLAEVDGTASPMVVSNLLGGLSRAHAGLRNDDRALELARRNLAEMTALGIVGRFSRSLLVIAEVLHRRGDLTGCEQHYREAAESCRATEWSHHAAEAEFHLARFARLRGDVGEAERLLEHAQDAIGSRRDLICGQYGIHLERAALADDDRVAAGFLLRAETLRGLMARPYPTDEVVAELRARLDPSPDPEVQALLSQLP